MYQSPNDHRRMMLYQIILGSLGTEHLSRELVNNFFFAILDKQTPRDLLNLLFGLGVYVYAALCIILFLVGRRRNGI